MASNLLVTSNGLQPNLGCGRWTEWPEGNKIQGGPPTFRHPTRATKDAQHYWANCPMCAKLIGPVLPNSISTGRMVIDFTSSHQPHTKPSIT